MNRFFPVLRMTHFREPHLLDPLSSAEVSKTSLEIWHWFCNVYAFLTDVPLIYVFPQFVNVLDSMIHH